MQNLKNMCPLTVASLIFDVPSDVSAAGNHTNPVGIFDLVKGGQCHIVLQV